MKLYPLLFKPNLHVVVWGGDRLCTYKNIESKAEPVGESWEVSAIPSSVSIIDNGDFAGQNLVSVIDQNPVEILGESVNRKYGGKMPLLVKFIDANKDLSIQVHPNDEMALRVHGKKGKSEMWYVIDARSGSYLYAGFKTKITQEEYCQRVADGTITEVLARHEVKAGDVFYLPAGRVHAICSGILLAEVQQSSDLTYRIFDYNRPGLDGKPRQLHTDLAAQALDFNVEQEYRTIYESPDNCANLLIDSPNFSVRIVELTETFHRNLFKYDSFVISVCISGECRIKIRATGDEVLLRSGRSCLIPAAIADYDVIPTRGTVKLLDAFIDNKDRSLGHRITRFLHLTSK